MPKLIVTVVDNDITKEIDDGKFLYNDIKNITNWLLRESQKEIKTYKDYLPGKAKCDQFPQFLWMVPPLHDNFRDNAKREIFAECLIRSTKFYKDMSSLNMVKAWNHDVLNNYLYDADRFMAEGLAKYWISVDCAIKYWNIAIFPKIGKMKKHANKKRGRNDQYHKNFYHYNVTSNWLNCISLLIACNFNLC